MNREDIKLTGWQGALIGSAVVIAFLALVLIPLYKRITTFDVEHPIPLEWHKIKPDDISKIYVCPLLSTHEFGLTIDKEIVVEERESITTIHNLINGAYEKYDFIGISHWFTHGKVKLCFEKKDRKVYCFSVEYLANSRKVAWYSAMPLEEWLSGEHYGGNYASDKLAAELNRIIDEEKVQWIDSDNDNPWWEMHPPMIWEGHPPKPTRPEKTTF